ncbi:MAG: arnE [Gammaproteobacteria bacterium]|jgi:multidrug transporter EmrE-like cation transporter|nr:arnE [Gammaproteobacteria bacterium]
MIFSLILLGVMLNASAQLLLKAGMDKIGQFSFSLHNALPIGFKAASNPFIICGLSCYVLSVVVWLLVLSRVEVSYAYPMLSIGYIVNAVAAYYLFGENLSLSRIIGIGVIIIGVYLIARPA